MPSALRRPPSSTNPRFVILSTAKNLLFNPRPPTKPPTLPRTTHHHPPIPNQSPCLAGARSPAPSINPSVPTLLPGVGPRLLQTSSPYPRPLVAASPLVADSHANASPRNESRHTHTKRNSFPVPLPTTQQLIL